VARLAEGLREVFRRRRWVPPEPLLGATRGELLLIYIYTLFIYSYFLFHSKLEWKKE
jgi:hypothetical protein